MPWSKRGEEVLSKYNSGWTRRKEVVSQRKENRRFRQTEKREKGIPVGEVAKWEGSMRKTTRNEVRKIGQKVKGIHVGEEPKRGGEDGEDDKEEGSEGRTERKKGIQEGE